MEERHDADWKPNWNEVGDLMRPITKDDEVPPPRVETPAPARRGPRGRLNAWRSAQQPQSRRIWGFVRHYAPYAILLLLAPQMEQNIIFRNTEGHALFQLSYWLVLGMVVLPLGLLCFRLRPFEERPVFRFAALMLPVLLYFMLQFSARHIPWIPIGLLLFWVIFVTCCHFSILPKSLRGALGDAPVSAADVEAAVEEERLEEICCGKPKPMTDHWRKLLGHSVCFLAAACLVLALPGVVPQQATVDIGLFTEDAAQVSAGHLQLLSHTHWGGLSDRERREVLQTLLNAETAALNMAPIALDDEAVFNLQSGRTMNIRRALRSGRNQTEARIRAVSYAAYHHFLAQSGAIDPEDFDERAAAHAEQRVLHYIELMRESGAGEPENEESDE